MTFSADITIVGAGPYGLSIAAHLAGSNFRIIGTPMESWINNMPTGMLLKSEGMYSNLHAPRNAFTLERFCKEQAIAYHDLHVPVTLETFTAYCLAFERQHVPTVERARVSRITQLGEGFELTMADGSSFTSRKVVIATGHEEHRNLPQQLADLPPEYCTHSGDHRDMACFKDKDVIVLGAGPSATETATLLHQNLARVQLLARGTKVSHFPMRSVKRPLMRRVRAPLSAVGTGWASLQWSDGPWLRRYLSDRIKTVVGKKLARSTSDADLLKRFTVIPKLLGYQILQAKVQDRRVQLTISDAAGKQRQLVADHVIAATGHRHDVRRMSFLDADIIDRLDLIENCPRLSAHFESSVPGLYFVGAISIPSFGSLMKFVAGAAFTTQRIIRSLKP